MKIWAVANQKGGVGKTTTAVTLAGLLAQRGQRVLLVDMDPHGSVTAYFKYDPDQIDRGVYGLFQAAAPMPAGLTAEVILPTRLDAIRVLPASPAMATLDRALGAREGMGRVLVRALEQVSDRFDYALIDCPPMLGVLMVNALAACEHLLIPVQTEFLALKGLERMLHSLVMIERARGAPLSYTIVPTLFDRRTHAAIESLRLLQERYPAQLWSGVIPVDTQLREASRAGVPLSWLAPRSRASVAYSQLLDHLTGVAPAATAEPAAVQS
jgi:chromosome partitioning protein